MSDPTQKVRHTVTRAAELVGMHPAHFRRLVRRGIFPKPRKTSAGRPYLDAEQLTAIRRIMESGVGENGQEVMFYRHRLKVLPAHRPKCGRPDPYLADLAAALEQFGIQEQAPARLAAVLKELFGADRPALPVALPAIARKLLE